MSVHVCLWVCIFLCVRVCVFLRTLWRNLLVWWYILTIYKLSLSIKIIGSMSTLYLGKCSFGYNSLTEVKVINSHGHFKVKIISKSNCKCLTFYQQAGSGPSTESRSCCTNYFDNFSPFSFQDSMSIFSWTFYQAIFGNNRTNNNCVGNCSLDSCNFAHCPQIHLRLVLKSVLFCEAT